MKHIAVVLAFLLLIAGCVYQQGHRFDANSVEQLKPGVSTEQDAIAQLGPPAATRINADGTRLLQWQYVYGTQPEATLPASWMLVNAITFRFMLVYELTREERAAAIGAIGQMLQNGRLINNVAATLPLSDIVAAHELVEQGSHGELMAAQGLYRGLIELQFKES